MSKGLELTGSYSKVIEYCKFYRKVVIDLKINKLAASVLLGLGVLFVAGGSTGYAKSTTLTPGIGLQSDQMVIDKRNQSINMLQVNLNNPYTTIDFGVSNPIEKTLPVTSLAKLHTFEQHHVVGAVNASVFDMKNGNPSYLLAKNNQIMFLGNGGEANTGFMYVPAAFGVTADNTAIVDRYNVDISIMHNDQTIKMDSYNKMRGDNSSVFYTSRYSYGYTIGNTRTNPYGYEVVVSGLSKNMDKEATFGETLTGKVVAIRPYGVTGGSTIPTDGFVLSASGSQVAALKKMQIGDDISVTLNIDDKWKDAKFMLASGPLLVQNGKVDMTIATSSGKATERTSRTAVAVDRTGKKVFMVTVDKKGSSKGMNMREFANYLVKQGAYNAINLDGGGSTTLAARTPWNTYATLVNNPQYGSQRYVSAILEAISTAPYGEPATFKLNTSSQGNMLVSGTMNVSVTGMLDSYNNVLNLSKNPVEYSVDSDIGKMVNSQFVAEKAGKGNVLVRSGNTVAKVPVTVEAQPTKLVSNVSSVYVGKGKAQKLDVTAYGSNNKPMNYNKNITKWSVKGNIGTIAADGTFKAGQQEGKGSIIATVSGKSITIPVTVSSKPLVISSLDSAKQWKAASSRAKTSLVEKKGSLTKGGKGYMGINYDFTSYKSGVSASYMKPASTLTIPSAPTSLSVWAWADGKKHWLRTQIKDRNGKVYALNFTEEYKLDWKGQWKQLKAVIPKGVAYPITVDSIYVAEGKSNNKNKGTIYLDELQANF